MPPKIQQFSLHPALGGLDISSDPSVLDPNFLTVANNVEYLEGGQRKKRGGTTAYSTGVTSTGTGTLLPGPVRGLADFWHYGTTLAPTQQLISVAGNSIFYSTGAGAWTPASVSSSFGSSGSTKTTITLAGDYAVINDAQGTSRPVAWDQTTLHTFTSSGGSGLPIYTAASYHLNRLFTGGLSTAPSAVNYTAANNVFDSTGTDTGSFTVAIGDGDQVMGLSQPFYGSLYIWKGPQFGSIYQLSGNTAGTFQLAEVAHGAPLLNPKALISTPTDIFWMSNYGIHSLQTTVKFGNVEQAFLSLPIQRLWRDRLITRGSLENVWGGWAPDRNIVYWAVTPAGSTTAIWLLVYNYALSSPQPGGKKFWSIWVLPFGMASGATMLVPGGFDRDQAGDPHMFFGGSNGQVYVGNQDAFDSQYNDAGQAYTYTIKTPVITRYPAQQPTPETVEKQHIRVTTYFNPKTPNATAQLTVAVDSRQQTYTVDLTGGGFRFDDPASLWDSAVFAGDEFNYTETPIDDLGRSISLRYDQTGLNQDCEILGYSVTYKDAESLAMENS